VVDSLVMTICAYSSVSRFQKVAIYACLVGLGALIGGSLWADTEDLGRLRSIYFEQVDEVTLPVKKQYGRSLVDLQKQLIRNNSLEEAIEVKAEIERLKKAMIEGGTLTSSRVVPGRLMAEAKSEKEEPKLEGASGFRWKGDFQEDKYQGDDIILMEADETAVVKITNRLDDVQKEFPKGFTWRFMYRSEDYQGLGFKIGFGFPAIGTLVTTGTSIRPNGNWIERTLPYSDTKGENEIDFEIHVLAGSGEVMIKDIELIPLP